MSFDKFRIGLLFDLFFSVFFWEKFFVILTFSYTKLEGEIKVPFIVGVIMYNFLHV